MGESVDVPGSQVISERLLSSLWVTYSTIASNRGLIPIENLLSELHVKRSQLYRHLQLLKFVGFVEVKKMGRKSVVSIREYFASKSDFERAFQERYNAKKSEDIYSVAMSIKERMVEHGICGDLFGAAKIHEVIPEHNRFTQDINVVVIREHAKFMNLLLNSMGFVMITDKSVHPYSDVTFMVPGTTWSIFVLHDGIKHPSNQQVRFFDLSRVLKEFKQIPIEYVLAAKVLRYPHLRRKEDSEDIVSVLASDVAVNLDRVARLVVGVVQVYPEFERVLHQNLETVENYALEYELNVHVVDRVRRSLEYLRSRLSDYLSSFHAQKVRA